MLAPGAFGEVRADVNASYRDGLLRYHGAITHSACTLVCCWTLMLWPAYLWPWIWTSKLKAQSRWLQQQKPELSTTTTRPQANSWITMLSLTFAKHDLIQCVLACHFMVFEIYLFRTEELIKFSQCQWTYIMVGVLNKVNDLQSNYHHLISWKDNFLLGH